MGFRENFPRRLRIAVLDVATFAAASAKGGGFLEPNRVGTNRAPRSGKARFRSSSRSPSELIENIRRTVFLASGGAGFSSTFFRPFFARVGNRFGRASDRRPSSLCGRALARLALNDRLCLNPFFRRRFSKERREGRFPWRRGNGRLEEENGGLGRVDSFIESE